MQLVNCDFVFFRSVHVTSVACLCVLGEGSFLRQKNILDRIVQNCAALSQTIRKHKILPGCLSGVVLSSYRR